MKFNTHLFTLAVISTLLFSCSQEKYAFRKKINVDAPAVAIITPKPIVAPNEIPAITKSPSLALQQPLSPVSPETEHALASADPSVVLPHASRAAISQSPTLVQPKIHSAPKQNDTPQKTTDGGGDGSGLAIAGFVCSLLGLLILPIVFSTLGIVFSANGMKSKYRGMAIAGLIMGIVGLAYVLFVIVSLS